MMDTKELKALAEGATKGKWAWDGRKVDADGYVHIPECSYLTGNICLTDSYEGYQEDCDFIAACSPATILALLSRNEELEARTVELLPQGWRETLANIAAFIASNVREQQNGPEDFSYASEFDMQLMQCADEIGHLLAAAPSPSPQPVLETAAKENK